MHSFHILLPFCITYALAGFLGPKYPAPVDLTSSESLVPAAWENLTSTFDTYLKERRNITATSSLAGVENVTFSVGLFSIHDAAVQQLQYHYTAPQIINAKNGTHKVNGDSIYRMASVTKLFTVFAGMLLLTDEDWNRPLTDILPQLAELGSHEEQSPMYTIQWDKITPWALAAQSAGVPSGGIPPLDILIQSASLATASGFPPVDPNSLGPCWNISDLSCPVNDFIEVVRSQPPSFLPWVTPAYANSGFMLLGIAISNIIGKPMTTIFRESIFEPLGMTSSNSTYPTGEAELARSVIAGDPVNFGIGIEAGVIIPSGGLYSTINDLAKFGLAILNSTLLSPNQTRKWMKPITHTASLTYSVGAPWEIIRFVHPSTGKVTDLYTKLGSSGFYGGIVVLIPDYGVGFSLLNACTNTIRETAINTVLDYITNAILPVLEAQAAAEAGLNFVGTYVSEDSNFNSSVTIALNESTVPGDSSELTIISWISNGTDVLASDLFGGTKPRLLLSIPNQSPDEAAGKVAFQASLSPQTNSYFAAGGSELGVIGPFTGQFGTNSDWLLVDSAHYAGRGVNLFVFDVDEKGGATAVSPAAVRVKLRRKR